MGTELHLPTLNLGFFEVLGHLSYMLMALSFLLRDILLLRLLAVVAAACNVAFSYGADADPSWISVFWQAVFILINTGWSARLVYERRGIRFSEEEKELYQTIFRAFSPGEFMKLMRLGVWHAAITGEVLARAGEPIASVILLYNGEIEVEPPRGPRRRLRDGAFIGEMSFIRGGAASATVRALGPTRYIAWDKQALRGLLHRNPSMRTVMQTVISEDLTRKLLGDGA